MCGRSRAGFVSSGVQFGIADRVFVAMVTASRIAVVGRQKLWNRFSFQQWMMVSAAATLIIPNRRASSTKLSLSVWGDGSERAVEQLGEQVALLEKRAMASCSSFALFAEPIAPRFFTLSYSSADAALLRLRGPGVRNCEADNSLNGVGLVGDP